MKQVIQSARTGSLKLVDVAPPPARAGSLLVRTTASVISPGTERMVIEFARKSLVGKAQARPDLVRKVFEKVRRDGIAAALQAVMARLDEPLPLGYSAAGVVEAVGQGLESEFRVGDRVAVAGAAIASHADLNAVPRNLVARVPDKVPDEEAAFATVASIALHGVRNLQAGLGDMVAVVGAGLVGLIAVQLLGLAGIRVVAIDTNGERLRYAQRFGAERTGAPLPETLDAVQALTAGRGVDAVLVAAATDSSEPLAFAAGLSRDRGRVVVLGKVGTEFPYADYMKKEISLLVSRSYGPGRYDDQFELGGLKYPVGWIRWTETENLAEVLRLMDSSRASRLDMASLVTHRFSIGDAEAAYRLVVEGQEPSLGVVLAYSDAVDGGAMPARSRARPSLSDCQCRLGVIGAGHFARSILLPELKRLSEVQLHTLVTARGISAESSRATFGFQSAGTDVADVLDNPEINAVLIATPHHSHAALTARALTAGKAVFVEKPLALDRVGLNSVIAARRGSSGFFMVGFNRRFAPMMVEARDRLKQQGAAKMLLLRVNAGPAPVQGWLSDEREGGRILGEACHFVDVARFLVGSRITGVQAAAPVASRATLDDAVITLDFVDGSVATVIYTSFGDPAVPKERFEAFSAGGVVSIDNFRTMTVTAGGRSSTRRTMAGADKGHAEELRAFVNAVKTGGAAPIDEEEIVETSLATIAALESLRSGRKILLNDEPVA